MAFVPTGLYGHMTPSKEAGPAALRLYPIRRSGHCIARQHQHLSFLMQCVCARGIFSPLHLLDALLK